MQSNRSSGILAHFTSLPSRFGIGDIGEASHRFIDFLVSSNQSYWQFLPTGPTNEIFDYSPYMSTSAFAGSYLLISPELLYKSGLISSSKIDETREFSPYFTEYRHVADHKLTILKHAFNNFNPDDFKDYWAFLQQNDWIDDYAVFMSAKEVYGDTAWHTWPENLARKDPLAIESFRKKYQEKINFYLFEQYIFQSQWQRLKNYALENHIKLFGDLPIYVGFDSVDVWAHQEIFCLDPNSRKPTHVAGVPPDYFSETGQRWGNPLYDWHNHDPKIQDNLLQWWKLRLDHLFNQVDTVRIDHFRAFESYWAIPEENDTAIHGQWLKGPGKPFFDKIFKELGRLDIIAEDLGIITPEVEKLRDDLNFPGMKVLQFAFDNNPENSFLPHNFTTTNCVAYTGTHDNNTTVGWYLSDTVDDNFRILIKETANRNLNDQHGIHNDLIYLAMSSIARLTIIPLQDVLGFGEDCRMNTPGTPAGNWKWRCHQRFLTDDSALHLAQITKRFNRSRNLQQLDKQND